MLSCFKFVTGINIHYLVIQHLFLYKTPIEILYYVHCHYERRCGIKTLNHLYYYKHIHICACCSNRFREQKFI